jgi:glycosyltransferase involved in cell wall biosynthesis
MSNPKVSIIMLTYDRDLFIGRAVQSVLDQKFTDWELIVVDDGTGNEAENVVRNHFKNDSRLKYFHRSRKTRIAGASNFGLAKAQGEYIAILDDDDYWATSAKLEKQVEFLDKNVEHVGCGGGYVLIDETGREQGRYLKPESDASIRKNALAANSMINSTTLFRRAVAEKIGGYDESLLEFADWDFWLKMGLRGKLYNFQEHFLYYRVWRGGASFLRQKEAARSAFQILNRYRGEYPGSLKGFAMAVSYLLHAGLPNFVKKYSSPFFSRLKKFLFSASSPR